MTIKHIRPFRFTIALFLALIMVLGFTVDNTRVFAVQDVQFYSGNDVLFYDPDAADCTASGGGGGTLRGSDPREKIWNYLIDKGLSPEQAAGVMGNMAAESGFVATRRQGTSDLWNSNFNNNAWGLAQWDGGRRFSAPKGGILGKLREKQPDLIKYTDAKYGGPSGDKDIPEEDLDALLLFELDFLYNESTNRRVTEKRFGIGKNEWETLKMQKTVNDATVFWHNNFEVSADSPERVIQSRGGAAKKAFDDFSKGTRAGVVDGGGEACTTPGGATGNLPELLMKYAWPDYHPKGYVKRMPEYIKAVEKAKDEGRYIGDPCHGGGVDCGAWVTILLNNSGFDPAYNHNGKLKDGAGYTVIQKAWAEKNWQKLGSGSSINVADLQPGDVAHLPGHTFLYVGKDIKGFGEGDSAFKGVASASQCGRAPMAGHESMTDSDVTWYRKK
jgi:hypothetical protein